MSTTTVSLPIPRLEELLLQSRDLEPSVLALIEERALFSYAPSTVKSLVSAYKDYPAWCCANDRIPVPASLETALLYYDERSQTLGPQAMRNRRKIVTLLHFFYDLPSINDHPMVRAYLRARLRAAKPPQAKEPFTPDDIRAMVRLAEGHPHPFQRARDTAILTFLFSSAPRSEEAGLALAEHITFFPNHIRWIIPRSKTDQYNAGHTVFVRRAAEPRFCPVNRMIQWREIYQGKSLFARCSNIGGLHSDGLTKHGIVAILKGYAERIGLDKKLYAGHSMRSGFVTAGYASNIPENDLAAVTRQSITTLRKYNHERIENGFNLTQAMGF